MINEEKREIPIRAEVDVLVVGGGLGGVAAAIAAGRAGANTLLVERWDFLGGVATAGMCCSIYNCCCTSDNRLETKGIAVEVVDALAEGEGYGKKWRNHKGHIVYDVERAKLTLAELVEKSGANVLFNVVFSSALMDGDRVKGAIIESKSGREAILAKTIVDATGDADVAASVGVPLKSVTSRHSMCFRLGNVDVDQLVEYFRENPGEYPEYMDVNWSLEESLAQYDDCGTFIFPHGGGAQLELFRKARRNGDLPESMGLYKMLDACQMHANAKTKTVHIITGFVEFDGLDIELITQSIHDGRKMSFLMADVFRKYIAGCEDSYVSSTGSIGVRISRYLDCEFKFTADMFKAGARCDDTVGRGVGAEDKKKYSHGVTWDTYLPYSDSFDLPYRCLLPERIDGLLIGSGRSISADNPRILRLMVYTMIVGQGAGVAAAVAALTGVNPREVDLKACQKQLAQQGVELNN